MRLGEFNYTAPSPTLRNPQCVAVIHPWLDMGNAGRLALESLAKVGATSEIASLTEPGKYYDFTRYRPILKVANRRRILRIPNTVVAKVSTVDAGWAHDLVLMNLLEPHALSERFNNSILAFLREIGISRYILLGAAYGQVPHTRPLPVYGHARNWPNLSALKTIGVADDAYSGATSSLSLLTEQLASSGLPTISLMVHLPSYLKIKNNCVGAARLLKVLGALYDTELGTAEDLVAQSLLRRVDKTFRNNSDATKMLAELEKRYDGHRSAGRTKPDIQLAPAVEQFLSQLFSTHETDNPESQP